MSTKRVTFLWLIAVFAFGCAQMVTPTGGEKDTTPPEILQSIPPNHSLYFNSEFIQFKFDEYLTLNDIGSELIISPPMKTRPEVMLKKKSVIVKLKEPLKPNTTYTFNFGRAIGDLNENNRLEIFNYVVSTGSELDSLSIFGTVVDAFNGKPAEGVKVMLYDSPEDSMPLTTIPYYFARSDKEGRFRINNMRDGDYQIFALREELTDYLYNSPEEDIAFADSLVRPWALGDTLATAVMLRMFNEGNAKPHIKNTRSDSTGKLTVELSRGLPSEFNIKPLEDVPFYTERTDSLRIWIDPAPAKRTYRALVSSDSAAIDTITMRLSKQAEKLRIEPGGSGRNQAADSIRILCDRPIIETLPDRMILEKEKDTVAFFINSFDTRPRELVFESNPPAKPGDSFKLTLLPGAIRTQAIGENPDTLKINIKLAEESFYGTLKFSIDLVEDSEIKGAGLIEFVNNSGEVTHRFDYQKGFSVVLPNIPPGRYLVRLIEDANENGKWDTGSREEKRQPERVFHMKDALEIRSNWEQKIKWKLKID